MATAFSVLTVVPDLSLSSRYIVFEIPANLFTKWLGPGKAIPLYTTMFGVLSIGCGFVNTFGAALAVRFLLGLAEAGKLPEKDDTGGP